MKITNEAKLTYLWKQILNHYELCPINRNNLYENNGYRWGDKIGVSIAKQCLKNHKEKGVLRKGHLFYFLNRLLNSAQYSTYFNKLWIETNNKEDYTIVRKHPIEDAYLCNKPNVINWIKDNCYLLIEMCGEESYAITDAEKKKLFGSSSKYDQWVKRILEGQIEEGKRLEKS